MDEIKQIINKAILLVSDILLFGYHIARKIIFPGKRTKGNILSSLLNFFVGFIDRLGSFEHGVFRMASLFRQKYIKQSLLIIVYLLFLLSSVEWSGDKNSSNNTGNYIAQFSEASVDKINISNSQEIISNLKINCPVTGYPAYKNILKSSAPVSSSVKTYLLIHCFRI